MSEAQTDRAEKRLRMCGLSWRAQPGNNNKPYKNVFVEEPRGADEGSVELDMALDVTTKLDEILAKLGKLDAIEATLIDLRQKMSSVEREVSKLNGDAGNAKERIDQMDTSLQWFNTEV